MVRVLLNGINGQMGRAMRNTLSQFCDQAEIVCGVDCNTKDCGVPVYSSAKDIATEFDVAVDFSVPQATMEILTYCKEHHKPIVICTTGLSDEQIETIRLASQTIPVFRSGNMSIGINLMLLLCKQARATLQDGFDVEIVETHHNRKIDAPSGTAKMLFDAVNSVPAAPLHPVYDRHSERRRREKSEVGMHSLRGGTVVGEHEVRFMGEDEVITIRHQAQSKSVFATGAFRAALYLAEQPVGMYDMSDLVGTML